jgi:hypothetical protein
MGPFAADHVQYRPSGLVKLGSLTSPSSTAADLDDVHDSLPRASLPQHDESAEKDKLQRLVSSLGLDGKYPAFCRRRGGICLDIPFYRTGFSETGNLGKSQFPVRTSQDLADRR